MYFARFLLPAVSTVLVMGASILERVIAHWVGSRTGVKAAPAVRCVALAAQPLDLSVRADYLLTRADTWTWAKQWIEANLPGGAKIAVDWPVHGPPSSTADMDGKPCWRWSVGRLDPRACSGVGRGLTDLLAWRQ
jgi:hypothetical protein